MGRKNKKKFKRSMNTREDFRQMTLKDVKHLAGIRNVKKKIL